VTASALLESSFSPATWVPQLICLVGLNPTCQAQSLLGSVVCSATANMSDIGLGDLGNALRETGAQTALEDECRREVTLERV